jgi:hypothetical protein
LFPESGMLLNDTAHEVVALCDGRRTVPEITSWLALRHDGADRQQVERDVLAFLDSLAIHALVRFVG